MAALTNGDQVSHWLVDGSTKDTRVQIGSGSRDPDLVVVDTSETVREARRLGVEPVIVCRQLSLDADSLPTRDAHAVRSSKEFVLLRLDELVEVLRSVLLHSLEAHLQVDLL